MEKAKVKIGFVPTRRINFEIEEAQRYKKHIFEALQNFDTQMITMDDLNDEGILHDDKDVAPVIRKMNDSSVDGIFFPHCNFGSEALVAQVAAAVKKPVLIWGPRDDAPLEDGRRTRDTQCGLFATGKVLRRFNVPFSYIVNSRVEDEVFQKGFPNFLAVCSVVKAFRELKILQIAPRPASFWTMMCNEGELLEKFGIEIFPVTLNEIAAAVANAVQARDAGFLHSLEQMKSVMDCRGIADEALEKMAAMKYVIRRFCAKANCNAAALQCWDSLQDIFGIVPCAVNGLLTDEGLPVACETDIHGAVSSIILQAAVRNATPVFLADLTVRHPTNDNAELLWHCGNFPVGLAKKMPQPRLGHHFIMPSHCPGTGEWELKGGDITICRFDGDHGEYSLLMGEGKGVDGPKTRGTYVWFAVKDWPKWEEKFVTGPYVHHCAGVHARVAPALYEACKYIPGLKPDPLEPTEEEIRQYLRSPNSLS